MFYLCRYNSRHFHSLICGIVEVWGSQSCRFCDFGKIALREKKAKWNQTVEFARTGGTKTAQLGNLGHRRPLAP